MMGYLDGLTDPRQAQKIRHNFIETVILVICAAIAGCDVWEDIADYCRVKEEWFREKVGLKLANGIPSHDTMERISGMLNPKGFRQSFIEGVQHTVLAVFITIFIYRRGQNSVIISMSD